MRWLMLVSSLDAADGGPPPAVLRLSQALVDRGETVTVLTHRHRDVAVHDDVVEAERHGVRIVWVSRGRATRFQFSPRLWGRARHLGDTHDVVVAHGFYQWTCVAAYLVSRRRGSRLMVQPHGVFEPYQEQVSRRVKDAFARVVGRRVLAAAGAVVATSGAEAKGIETTWGRAAPPVVVAGLGVTAGPGELAPPAGLTTRNVLFLSRIAPKKRLDKLLTAAGILEERGRGVVVTVCGDGAPDFVEATRRLAPAGVDVRWRGHVTGPVRSSIESQQALLCLPSDNENFGQAVTEAMAVGLPVLTTRATGASEHVVRAEAGWVLDDPTPTQLADAIDVALADPAELARMSRRAVAYSRSELTWDSVAERWVERARTLSR